MQVVEYLKPYEGEVPFRLNNEKWEYCWGKYPNGKTDVAVYRYGTDMAYDYNDFRSAFNLDQERPSAPNKVSENKNQKDNMNTTKTTTNEATVKTAAPKVPTKNFEETKPKSTDASKHVKGSVPAQKKSVATAPTKKTEAPKTVAKDATKHIKGGKVDPAGTTKSQVKPKVGPFEKAKIKENEVITNAATKHLLSMKAGDGHKENMAKIPSESNPGEEKMALGSKGAPATKQETRAPKAPEKKPNESLPAEKSKAAAPPKQETRAPKAPEKTPGEPLKVSKDATKEIKGGAAEVGGKKSSLPNMKEEESWKKTRAGNTPINITSAQNLE